MATLVTIPTGVQNRRGSDGSGFAIGKQTAAGTALDPRQLRRQPPARMLSATALRQGNRSAFS